ncbi:hypothetical protein [Streptomyces griseoloalbus]|uniref:Uncharacterized protein n=1 Tax=Streptomyces griseoloalbus TaxID=67303 RepID=A0A7W8BSH5_9ACTN|nr:hypothetical protein [Streptomyces albaduncus]MBB5127631.1 hypothetical protein [Streptomyces albaduncus]GGW62324.1 hypothetical protein GCM10010340_45790 [Streptomyces albaduncus]
MREREGRGEADDGDVGTGGVTEVPRPGDVGPVSRAPGEADTVAETPAWQEAAPTSATPSRSVAPDAVAGAQPAVEPVLRILPLGSGLVLIGLGLGLAFVALRMRQGGGMP